MELNNIKNQGSWSSISNSLNENFAKIIAEMLKYKHITTISGANFVGYYANESLLPEQSEAAWAVVGELNSVYVYAYYVEGSVPTDMNAGWNMLSSLGTYDFSDYSELLTKIEETDTKVSELDTKVSYINGFNISYDASVLLPGYLINAETGETEENVYRTCTDYLPVYPNAKVEFPTYGTLSPQGYAYYDKNKNYIQGASIVDGKIHNITEVAPEDAYFLRTTYVPQTNSSYNGFICVVKIDGSIDNLNKRLLLVEEGIGDSTELEEIELTQGEYYNTNDVSVGGTYKSDSPSTFADFSCTKISVRNGDSYKIIGAGTAAGGLYVLTDVNDKVIDCLLGHNSRNVPVNLNINQDGTLYINNYIPSEDDHVYKILNVTLENLLGRVKVLENTESVEIINNLNDYSIDKALSANQGRLLGEELYGKESEVVEKNVTVTDNRLSTIMTVVDYPILQKKVSIKVTSSVSESEKYRIYFESPMTMYLDDLSQGVEYTFELPEEYDRIRVFTPNNFEGTNTFSIVLKESEPKRGLIKELENVGKPLSGKTIVCFGDSLTELSGDGKKYSDYIQDLTGATVYNVGIGGTQIRQRSVPTSTPSNAMEGYAGLDIVNLIKSVSDKDFTIPRACAEWVRDNIGDDNTDIVERLANIDFSVVDAVTFFAGTNDFYGGQELGEEGSELANKTLGAINIIIPTLLTSYPKLKIYWFTPIVRYCGVDLAEDRTNDNWSDNYINGENITLPAFIDKLCAEVKKWHIPICDMYWSLGGNQANFSNYFLDTDSVHPYKGFEEIGRKISAFLIANNTF